MSLISLLCVLAFVSSLDGSVIDNRLTYPELVEKINILNLGWKAKMYPQFADMTIDEAKKWLGANLNGKPQGEVVSKVASKIPDSFDARSKWPGSIHPIRNQGACGSCWAFGASESLSDRFSIASQNRINVVLSAQQLVDCDKDNHGCGGGWPIKAWNYMKEVGLLTEQCYGPYEARDEPCKANNSSITQCPSGAGAAKFYHAETAYSIAAKNVQAMQTDIMTYGPIEAAFTVYQDFYNYRSGVYAHTSGRAVGGHAIKILGWGIENGEDYWLCANSWGPRWGEQGFFKIRRGVDECYIEDGCTAGQPNLNQHA